MEPATKPNVLLACPYAYRQVKSPRKSAQPRGDFAPVTSRMLQGCAGTLMIASPRRHLPLCCQIGLPGLQRPPLCPSPEVAKQATRETMSPSTFHAGGSRDSCVHVVSKHEPGCGNIRRTYVLNAHIARTTPIAKGSTGTEEGCHPSCLYNGSNRYSIMHHKLHTRPVLHTHNQPARVTRASPRQLGIP